MKAKIWNEADFITGIEDKHIKDFFEKLLLDSNFNICGFIDKVFSPCGYTAIWLLSESHLAVHTFPESNKIYYELASCNKKKYTKFCNLLNYHYENIIKSWQK